MEKFKKLFFKFWNVGYDEPIYQKYRYEIVQQNSRMVKTTSFIGAIMMAILTIASLFMSSVSKVLPLYFGVAVLFTLICLIAHKAGTKNGTLTLVCNYAFLTAAFFFAVGLDVIQKSVTATTICVLLVALPLLIVDKPYREFIFFLIVTICFMLESVYIKQSPKASIDVLNGLSFLVVGTFLGYKHDQMVIRNIRGHCMLKEQRDIDTLTCLYNKGALEDRVTELFAKAQTTATLIVIDMDNFKFVNDTYGHHTGDELLAKIGELLGNLFRSDDLISRFGGDEFVVVLPMMDDKDMIRMRAEQILAGVKQIQLTADPEYKAHVCMGIATYPADGTDYETLFKNADTAMYSVKKNGKNGYGFYDANLKKKILIVDDIEVNRVALTVNLSEDYEVFQASDGQTAWDMLEKHRDIMMVITDIQMPHMDGIELIQKIRSDREMGDVAIIANTQQGDPDQEEKIGKMGVDDFVYKAASPQVIQMRVKNVLKAREDSR